MNKKYSSRRKFLTHLSVGVGGAVLFSSFGRCGTQTKPAISNSNKEKKLGVALVGLGNYSTAHLGPALLKTKNCYLAGVVTGTPTKENIWAEKYGIPQSNIYNYQNFDSIKDNKEIDIV